MFSDSDPIGAMSFLPEEMKETMKRNVQTVLLILLGAAAVVISPLAFHAETGHLDSPLKAKTREALQSWADCPAVDETAPDFIAARFEVQERMYGEGRDRIVQRLDQLKLDNEMYRRVHHEDDFLYARERQQLESELSALSPDDFQGLARQELLKPSGECAERIGEMVSRFNKLFFFFFACFVVCLVVIMLRSAPEEESRE